MLTIHLISGLSAITEHYSGYGLLVLDRGFVRLSAKEGNEDELIGVGVYFFSSECRVTVDGELDAAAELVCFDRAFFVSFARNCHLPMGCEELEAMRLPKKIDGVDLAAIKRDLDLLKLELNLGGDLCRLRLAFALLMYSLFPVKTYCGLIDGDRFSLEEFNELLEDNFRSCRSTDFYARRLGVSARKLNSWCRGWFSAKGFYAVLIDRLMSEAECRLVCSDEPIKVIAYELGFKSVQHFRTYFVRYRGMSPSQFRLKYSNTVEADQLF